MSGEVKQFLKKCARVIFRSRIGRALISHAIVLYIHFVMITSRVQIKTANEIQPYLNGDKSAIFTFWHGRILLMPYFTPKSRRIHALISIHRDGEWLAGVIARFGLGLVRGSSSRRGHAALRDAMQVLQAGDSLVITPDGPRGPAKIAQQGAAALSSLTGVPIIPVSVSARSRRHINSWDRFMIVLPFSKVCFVTGQTPIFVPLNADEATISETSAQLTTVLRQLGQIADESVAS